MRVECIGANNIRSAGGLFSVGFLILVGILLLFGPAIVSLVVLARTGRLVQQTERLEQTLADLRSQIRSLSPLLSRLEAAPFPAAQPPAAAPSSPPASVPDLPPQPDHMTTHMAAAAAAEPMIQSEPAPSAPAEPAAVAPPAPEDVTPLLMQEAVPPVSAVPAVGADETPAPPPQKPVVSERPVSDTQIPQPPSPPRGTDFGDFEKRFGTQWVVWIGGIALALGGIFLVRYSIEQGLFGPGLRIIFGAVLALSLVGLGELARRSEIISGISDLPNAAHIPSILTAASTTCAYADIYAAYAIYEFLSPAIAFLLLGIVALATLAAALRHGPALGGLGLVGAYVTPLLVHSSAPSY
jgi:hypothetical protein